MQRKFTILLLAWIALSFQVVLVTCLRIPKENPRLKSKCFTNITSGPADSSTTPNRVQHCIALNHPYCLGLKLPYNATTLPESITDLNLRTSQEVTEYLEQWRGVERVPRCWPILRVALCSLLMPQCEEVDSTVLQVHQPSVDICNDLVKNDHCKFVERHLEGWPSIFNCSDSRIYAKNCSNELRDLRHVESNPDQRLTTCHYPLVSTNDESNFFRDVSGCALHCKYPITSQEEQANIKLTISVLCLLGITSTTTALILYTINRAESRPSRMAKVMKRCTVCQLLLYIGWSLQLFMDREIGCRPDGSALYGQPLVANLCVLSFLLTYLPSLSSLLWCAHLGKLFHEKLDGFGESGDHQEGNTELDRTLSIFSYGIPLTLFVSVAFLGNIDGHGLYGICTVGQESILMKTVFVFLPTLVGTIYGNYYFIRIVARLASTEQNKMKPSLKRNFMRISALSALTILQILFTTADYYYEHTNRNLWLGSIEDFVACQLDLTSTSHRTENTHQTSCHLAAKPVATLYYLEILSTLGLGLVISSWAYCDSNYRGLRRKFIDLLMDEKENRRRALMYLERDDNLNSDHYPALRQGNECDSLRRDPIDMNLTAQTGRERALEWNVRAPEQTELLPQQPNNNQLVPDPASVAAMLLFQSTAMMKMQAKFTNQTNANPDSAPTFTHALSSNPITSGPSEPAADFNVQRRPSFGPSERSSIGSISLAINAGGNSDDSGNSNSKRTRRRLPRKRHASLKNFRARHVIRDIKKQRLNQEGQLSRDQT